jgi:hypothetical protein
VRTGTDRKGQRDSVANCERVLENEDKLKKVIFVLFSKYDLETYKLVASGDL